ncbi:MAG: OmpA family protein [Chitinophagaceae bacterium]|nr:MAG: OmpA family protein [Chitinophagaceae bacterium]
MKIKTFVLAIIVAGSSVCYAHAQTQIAVSKADPGNFPYFKTLSNFKPTNVSDSATDESNIAWFYDGKKFFSVEGEVSYQRLSVIDDSKKIPSEAQLVQEFDKMITTLGGKKLFSGRMPEEGLKKATNDDIVGLSQKHQVAYSAHYGVIEYVVKTADKEIWVQLVPGTIASKYYGLFVVDKKSKLISTNTNKQNNILADLEKAGKASVPMIFAPDSDTLLTDSKDEILSIVGALQKHPDWKLKIDVHCASVGKPGYAKALTDKRAAALKAELTSLGASSITITGAGDSNPFIKEDTEIARVKNSRIEITKL